MEIERFLRRISDKDSTGNPLSFVVPDLVKLMGAQLQVQTYISLPISKKSNTPAFWESGGCDPTYTTAVGTVIASSTDQILDPILFNKMNKTKNGKEALIGLRPGTKVYIGKINTRRSTLAPKIRVYRLIYVSDDPEVLDYAAGIFILDEIFSSYSELAHIVPASRLIDKLMTKNVMKSYFANGWSVSTINMIPWDTIHSAFSSLYNTQATETIDALRGDKFIDAVENELVSDCELKLSAVFQWIDFNTGILGLKILNKIQLSNIPDTISSAGIHHKVFSTPIESLLKCHNPNLLFEAQDVATLQFTLSHDDKYSVEISPGVYCMLRGYRG